MSTKEELIAKYQRPRRRFRMGGLKHVDPNIDATPEDKMRRKAKPTRRVAHKPSPTAPRPHSMRKSELIAKYNHNHGKDGKFVSSGAGGGKGSGSKATVQGGGGARGGVAATKKLPTGAVGLSPGMSHTVAGRRVKATAGTKGHRDTSYSTNIGTARAWTDKKTGKHYAEGKLNRSKTGTAAREFSTASQAHRAAIASVSRGNPIPAPRGSMAANPKNVARKAATKKAPPVKTVKEKKAAASASKAVRSTRWNAKNTAAHNAAQERGAREAAKNPKEERAARRLDTADRDHYFALRGHGSSHEVAMRTVREKDYGELNRTLLLRAAGRDGYGKPIKTAKNVARKASTKTKANTSASVTPGKPIKTKTYDQAKEMARGSKSRADLEALRPDKGMLNAYHNSRSSGASHSAALKVARGARGSGQTSVVRSSTKKARKSAARYD